MRWREGAACVFRVRLPLLGSWKAPSPGPIHPLLDADWLPRKHCSIFWPPVHADPGRRGPGKPSAAVTRREERASTLCIIITPERLRERDRHRAQVTGRQRPLVNLEVDLGRPLTAPRNSIPPAWKSREETYPWPRNSTLAGTALEFSSAASTAHGTSEFTRKRSRLHARTAIVDMRESASLTPVVHQRSSGPIAC